MFSNNFLANSNVFPAYNHDSSISAISNRNIDSSAANSHTENSVQFAPSFLFGQPHQGTKRRHFAPHLPNGGGLGGKSVHWSPLLVREHSSNLKKDNDKKDCTKSSASTILWNGPPLRSITDDPPLEKQPRGNALPYRFTSESNHSSNPYMFSSATSKAASSISENDNSKKLREQDFWVTVFGFSHDQTTLILELFSKHGNIVSHKTPKAGNWVHVRYSSTIHTNQALARNGKVFNGNMIGVILCRDPEIFSEELNNENFVFTSPNIVSLTTHLNHNDGADDAVITANKCLNNTSMVDNSKDFVFNGSRIIPSVSGNSFVAGANESLNVSRQSRLSISSRTGMRPLNSNSFVDESLYSSIHGQKIEENSFFGKFWNYISQP